MKEAKYLFLLLVLLLTFNLSAYQRSFLNLVSPSELGDLESEISISHRFKGAVDDEPLDNFFGLQNGANVGLFFRQAFIHQAELKLGYIMAEKEYIADASWKFTPYDLPVQAQADIQFFSFEQFDFASNEQVRKKNVLLLLSVQNKPIRDRLILNTNLGFEAETERLVAGFGIGVILLPSVTLLGEYYLDTYDPEPLEDILNFNRKNDTYVLGIKLDTYGHHFMFMLGNSDSITLRKASMGSDVKDLRLGFNIQRHMNFFGR